MWPRIHTNLSLSTALGYLEFFPLKYFDNLKRNIAFLLFLYITFMLRKGGGGQKLLSFIILYFSASFRLENGIFNKSWFTLLSPLFRGRFVKEWNNLNFIFYITLLQSHETLQDKSKITLSEIKRWLRKEVISYFTFVAKYPSVKFQLGNNGSIAVQWTLMNSK